MDELLDSDTSYPAGSRILEVGCGVGAQTVTLASNSPSASLLSIDIFEESITEAKEALEKSANLTVDQGLEYAKLWSTSFLVSEDLREGVMAFLEKRDPKFNE